MDRKQSNKAAHRKLCSTTLPTYALRNTPIGGHAPLMHHQEQTWRYKQLQPETQKLSQQLSALNLKPTAFKQSARTWTASSYPTSMRITSRETAADTLQPTVTPAISRRMVTRLEPGVRHQPHISTNPPGASQTANTHSTRCPQHLPADALKLQSLVATHRPLKPPSPYAHIPKANGHWDETIARQRKQSSSMKNNQQRMPLTQQKQPNGALIYPQLEEENTPCKQLNQEACADLSYKKHWREVHHSLKLKAELYDLNFEILRKSSEEVGNTLPSSRSLREMKKIPFAWAELYEDEAWILPQNDLLDKKYHWWRKVDAWWKEVSMHFTKPIFSLSSMEKNYIEDSVASLSTVESLSNRALPSSVLISASCCSFDHTHQIFQHFNQITEESCVPLLQAIHGKSVLGNRRAAINQWIVDVAVKFKFHSSTYSLCMQLLDSYLEAKMPSKYPVNIDNPAELMVVCVACLLLAAAMREHWYHPEKDAYLKMIINNSTIKFTHEDVVVAQADILSTVPPLLPASYIMFDYCLLFLAELRDIKVEGFLSSELFVFVRSSGLLLWLFQLLQNANKFVIEECVNLRVPGSRVAACLLLKIFSEFCGKSIEKDVNWCRLFAHHVLHMYFDGDISFWWKLLHPIIEGLFKEIQLFQPQLAPWFELWKLAGKEWRALQNLKVSLSASELQKTPTEHPHSAGSTHSSKRATPIARSKRDRYALDDIENTSPLKQRRIPLKLQQNFMNLQGM